MASTFIQFRADEDLKIEASLICKKLGIDLQTYMRMCLYRLVSNKGVPFDMILKDETESEGIEALLKMNSISEKYNNSEMTIDEINNEINEARKWNIMLWLIQML